MTMIITQPAVTYPLSIPNGGTGSALAMTSVVPSNAIVANTTVSIPAGYMIVSIQLINTTVNAVTGGVRIGTTGGAADVVSAQAVGASAFIKIAETTVLKPGFSTTVAQTLFIEAVVAWNSASLNMSFLLARTIP